MTGNLDERLSDALGTAARTVPDNAVPPELFRTSVRRRRPVLVVALAVAAVLAAVAVPLAVSQRHKAAPPASPICPTPPSVAPLQYPQQEGSGLDQLPFGPPPNVPFTVKQDREAGGGYLEDRGIRVPLPAEIWATSIGRVECGWAVLWQKGHATLTELGVLSTSGSFRSFGLTIANGFALSPDGMQLAYVARGPESTELRVAEVKSGKVLGTTPASNETEVVGWNNHGVWLLPDRTGPAPEVWRPGSNPVPVDTGGRRLTAYRSTDRMLLTNEGAGSDACIEVATLGGDNRLTKLLEKCGVGGEGTLSPDGRVLVTGADDSAGYVVDTDEETPLRAKSVLGNAHHLSIWEDSTHLLQSTGSSNSNDPDNDRLVTYRCDVLTGECERIQDGPVRGVPAGPDLGHP